MKINNKDIPDSIEKWTNTFDSNNFLTDSEWLNKAELTEDILQLEHVDSNGPAIDVGFYNKTFKIYVIYNSDWENPKELFESDSIEFINNKIYELIDKYA